MHRSPHAWRSGNTANSSTHNITISTIIANDRYQAAIRIPEQSGNARENRPLADDDQNRTVALTPNES